ncbi:anion transporter [uncultured Bosea sp.]|uniref:anion transporter n=1 Tax=uncultured Bosea sp. TaxID=211457 RepID=UPI0025D50C01|nr:anion transporter [uncultured Bosea sp.]
MTGWTLNATQIAAIAIFLATYVAIAVGRLPGLRVDRAGAALIGAALMVGCGVLSLEDAYRAIDLDTITLLLGMMIVVANLRLSGFFRMVTGWAAGRARHPALLLSVVVITTGVLSAFLVNDAICLVMAPIVITLTRALDRNPVPYLIAVALASNVGSTATITGNPQNMIIGNLSGISYGAFTGALLPIAALGLLVTILLVLVLNPREYMTRQALRSVTVPAHYHGWLATKAALASVAMIALFFLGQPVAKVAICAAALLLLTRRIEPRKVYAEIDGPLLLMFAGLFVVVRGLEHAVLTPDLLTQAARLDLGNVAILTGVTAILSNLVSNVPAVLVLKPFVEHLHDPQRAWLVVAMASTLAGNFTLLGSVANLIVAERAAKDGITVDFWTYFKVGAPLTIATLAVGVLVLSQSS